MDIPVKGLLTALLLLSAFGSASADEWRTDDTYRQASYYVLLLADWRQTRQIASDPDYYEHNPVLGENPTRSEVDRYFTIGAVAHFAVSRVLPQKYRSWWQYTTLAFQAGTVGHNLQIGLDVEF